MVIGVSWIGLDWIGFDGWIRWAFVCVRVLLSLSLCSHVGVRVYTLLSVALLGCGLFSSCAKEVSPQESCSGLASFDERCCCCSYLRPRPWGLMYASCCYVLVLAGAASTICRRFRPFFLSFRFFVCGGCAFAPIIHTR